MRGGVLIALAVYAISCGSVGAAPVPTPSATARPAPSREPSALATYPEEQDVLNALTQGGIRVELVGGSKFETLLGVRNRARVFIGTGPAGDRIGADVLFLDRAPGDVRVCTGPGSAPGFTAATITVNGAEVSHGEGSQSLYYLLGDRVFVFTTSARVRDVLQNAMGLAVPRC